MGAWGEKAFENDAALDWLGSLDDEGIDAVRGVLSHVAEAEREEYLDVDDGAAAIAAAEVVAASRHGSDRLTKKAKAWLTAHAPEIADDDLALARRAVERVLVGGSELRDLWNEAGPDNGWRAQVDALLVMLGGDPQAIAEEEESALDDDDDLGDDDLGDEHPKQALLTFLFARGLVPDARQRARIEAGTEAEVTRWLGRALTVKSVAELFEG